MHSPPTIRRFCRAKMTHLGQGCPAVLNDHRSPPGTPRRRTSRFSGGDCTGSCTRSNHGHRASCMAGAPWRAETRSRRGDGHNRGPKAPAVIRSRVLRRRPQKRPSKIAQDGRSGICEGCGSAPRAQIASWAVSGEIDHHPCSATARTPHPTRPIGCRRAAGEIPTRRLRFPQISTAFSLHNPYYTKWSKGCEWNTSQTSKEQTTWHARSGKAASASAW
jgi:hypothetical protein